MVKAKIVHSPSNEFVHKASRKLRAQHIVPGPCAYHCKRALNHFRKTEVQLLRCNNVPKYNLVHTPSQPALGDTREVNLCITSAPGLVTKRSGLTGEVRSLNISDTPRLSGRLSAVFQDCLYGIEFQ